MNDQADLVLVFAEAHEAAARVFRRKAEALRAVSESQSSAVELPAVDRIRAVHPQIGTRQEEIVELLDRAGSHGLNTGELSTAMGYEQSNVYLTLSALMRQGFVEKDATTSPHTYRLAPQWRQSEGGEAA